MVLDRSTRLNKVQATDAIRQVFGFEFSPATLDTYRSRGRGPTFTRFGRSVTYTWGDVEDWVRGRTEVCRNVSA